MTYNTLSLAITESYTLDFFNIIKITVEPNQRAVIEIEIMGSNGKLYNRILALTGEDYTDWVTDDYLYSYIQKNISTIFG